LKVLVVRAGALGDLLLLRPVVASLRQAGAEVTLLAPERPASALVGPGPEEAQALVSWDRADIARLLDPTAATSDLEATLGRFDVVLCYSRSEELAGPLRRLTPRLIVRDPHPPQGHAADWFAGPLRDLGLETVDPAPMYPNTTEATLAALDGLPPRFLAIHPGSGSPRKNWPAERFAQVAQRAARGRWLLSLGPADEREAAALAGAAGAVLTRDLPPRALGALLSHAGIYVGNDSGVTHLAAACGVPTVALFGPTSPQTWAPRGIDVALVASRDETMDSIAVEDVVTAIERLRRR
jgi:heptosyltransferase III